MTCRTTSHSRDLQAWCGGAAGVVNQAVANERTATSQHQGHTSPRAPAVTQTPHRLVSRTCPSPPEPQPAAVAPPACAVDSAAQVPGAVCSPAQTAPLRKENHSQQHWHPQRKWCCGLPTVKWGLSPSEGLSAAELNISFLHMG